MKQENEVKKFSTELSDSETKRNKPKTFRSAEDEKKPEDGGEMSDRLLSEIKTEIGFERRKKCEMSQNMRRQYRKKFGPKKNNVRVRVKMVHV